MCTALKEFAFSLISWFATGRIKQKTNLKNVLYIGTVSESLGGTGFKPGRFQCSEAVMATQEHALLVARQVQRSSSTWSQMHFFPLQIHLLQGRRATQIISGLQSRPKPSRSVRARRVFKGNDAWHHQLGITLSWFPATGPVGIRLLIADVWHMTDGTCHVQSSQRRGHVYTGFPLCIRTTPGRDRWAIESRREAWKLN